MSEVRVVFDSAFAAGIEIGTAAEAESYLRFFCDFLHMQDGRCIRIVDALRPGWATDRREAVDIAPPAVWESERAGLFRASAHVEYDGVLFIAEFAIRADSIVAMLEDETVGRLVRHPIHYAARERQNGPAFYHRRRP